MPFLSTLNQLNERDLDIQLFKNGLRRQNCDLPRNIMAIKTSVFNMYIDVCGHLEVSHWSCLVKLYSILVRVSLRVTLFTFSVCFTPSSGPARTNTDGERFFVLFKFLQLLRGFLRELVRKKHEVNGTCPANVLDDKARENKTFTAEDSQLCVPPSLHTVAEEDSIDDTIIMD